MRKKLSVFVLILVLGSVASLISSGCAGAGSIPEPAEIKYDIRGQWTIKRIFDRNTLTIVATFTGDKNNGAMVPDSDISGIYHVGGNGGIQVEFYFSYYENGNQVFENFQGTFTNEDLMTGTGSKQEYFDGLPFHVEFAWGATRN
jgi:hypothetical protein